MIESGWGDSMRLRNIRWSVSVLLLSVSLFPESDAQTTTSGALAGVVTDQSSAIVQDADVEITDQAKGTVQSTRTDREGAYRFFFLPPGRYTLTVTHPGFREQKRTVNVLLGPPVSLNLTLTISPERTTMTVTGDAPLVHAENGDASSTLNQQQVSELPNNGNDLTYIAQSTPGTIMNTDGGLGNFSILGMPGTSNLFTLNGMSDTDMAFNVNKNGPLGLLLGQNQIQEVTVVTNGYSGQSGTLAGAHVNYITKSGSGQFHGNAEYFWNGRVLNANDWFNNAVGNARPFSIANQWAGSVGGPIRKNQLFFFFDTEGLRITVPQNFQVVLPSPEFQSATLLNIRDRSGLGPASEAFYEKIFDLYNATPGIERAQNGSFDQNDPTGCVGFAGLGDDTHFCAIHFAASRGRPTYESLISGRVDWNVKTRDRVFLLGQYDKGRQAYSTDPISPLFDVDSDQPWWQAQLVETHAFGPSAANQFEVSGSWQSGIFQPRNLTQALAAFPTHMNWCLLTCIFSDLGPGFGTPTGNKTTQWQISDDLVKIWSRHKIGIGVSFQRFDWSLAGWQSNTGGTLEVPSLESFFEGGVADPSDPTGDAVVLAQAFNIQNNSRIADYNLGFYGQDEWRARPNLTFTVAMRVEHQSNPVCRENCFARPAGQFDSISHDPNQPYDQAILVNQHQAYPELNRVLWAPRMSVAWQPFGVGHSTVLRGGFGVFYDSLPGAIAFFVSTNPPLSNSFTVVGDNLAPGESTNLFSDALGSNRAFVDGFNSGQTLAQIQAVVAKVSPTGFSPPALTAPDRTMFSPRYQKWSLELQQVFGVNTSLTVGYFGNHGVHELIRNLSANAFGFGDLPVGLCASPPVQPCADARFSRVERETTAGISNYNGLVTSFRRRFPGRSKGLFQASYTYGHAFDEVSNGGFILFIGGSAGYPITPQDPNNFRGSYGPADYDVRHSFNANYVWEVPVKMLTGNRGPDSIVKGWQVSGTVFAHSGFPYSVYDDQKSFTLQATNNFGGELYAVPVGPLPHQPTCTGAAAAPFAPRPCLPPQMKNGVPNPAALFIQANCTTGFNVGNLPNPNDPTDLCGGPLVSIAQGRNHFRDPQFVGADFAVIKNTKLPRWENGQLGIGLQFFNVFNHPNFGLPDGFTSSSTYGQIVYTAKPPTGTFGGASARMIQLKAQIQF
jgi:hypothetical protein